MDTTPAWMHDLWAAEGCVVGGRWPWWSEDQRPEDYEALAAQLERSAMHLRDAARRLRDSEKTSNNP